MVISYGIIGRGCGVYAKPSEVDNVVYVYSEKPIGYPEFKEAIRNTKVLTPIRNKVWLLEDGRRCMMAVINL
jgi:hypothetical protein